MNSEMMNLLVKMGELGSDIGHLRGKVEMLEKHNNFLQSTLEKVIENAKISINEPCDEQ